MPIIDGTPDPDNLSYQSLLGEIYTLNGFAGADLLHFYGGAGALGRGDFFLNGGSGSDTYSTDTFDNDYNDIGSSVISDDSGAADKLVIDDNPADWTFSVSGHDLILTHAGYAGEITIQNQFGPGGANAVETIEFTGFATFNLIEALDAGDNVYSATASTSAFGSIHNTVNGLGGNDTIFLGQGDDTGYGGEGNDTLRGNQGDDNLYGGLGDDTLYGDAGIDTIQGNAGNDTIYGGHGNDTIYGNAGTDTIYGEAGADTIYGGADADTIYGGSANDILYGETGSDTMFGDSGADTLFGGNGLDIMTGGVGGGGDTFVMQGEFAFNNRDEITDFVNGSSGDHIDIADVLSDFGYDSGSDTLSDWVSTVSSGPDTILQVDRDGAGGAYSMSGVLLIQGQTLSLNDLTANGNLITEGNLA